MKCLIETREKTDHLWYCVDGSFSDYLVDERADAFLLALLPYAMSLGEDIEVLCPVSERLFYNVRNYIMNILPEFFPSYKKIELNTLSLDSGQLFESGNAVVTGISGGVDSFCSVADHHFNTSAPTSYRLSHLIYNNVGSHGRGGRALFEARWSRIHTISQELGLPIIRVDSNIRDFTAIRYVNCHSLVNASSAMTLQKLFGKFLYASTFHYSDCFIGEANDIAFGDPALVHLYSTESLQSILTGSQYTRPQKVEIVSELPITYRYLDVCVNNDHLEGNCSTCRKCFRTLFALELLGKIDLYDKVFDLDKYHKSKRRYLRKVRQRKIPRNKELYDLAREKNFRFPWSTLIY